MSKKELKKITFTVTERKLFNTTSNPIIKKMLTAKLDYANDSLADLYNYQKKVNRELAVLEKERQVAFQRKDNIRYDEITGRMFTIKAREENILKERARVRAEKLNQMVEDINNAISNEDVNHDNLLSLDKNYIDAHEAKASENENIKLAKTIPSENEALLQSPTFKNEEQANILKLSQEEIYKKSAEFDAVFVRLHEERETQIAALNEKKLTAVRNNNTIEANTIIEQINKILADSVLKLENAKIEKAKWIQANNDIFVNRYGSTNCDWFKISFDAVPEEIIYIYDINEKINKLNKLRLSAVSANNSELTKAINLQLLELQLAAKQNIKDIRSKVKRHQFIKPILGISTRSLDEDLYLVVNKDANMAKYDVVHKANTKLKHLYFARKSALYANDALKAVDLDNQITSILIYANNELENILTQHLAYISTNYLTEEELKEGEKGLKLLPLSEFPSENEIKIVLDANGKMRSLAYNKAQAIKSKKKDVAREITTNIKTIYEIAKAQLEKLEVIEAEIVKNNREKMLNKNNDIYPPKLKYIVPEGANEIQKNAILYANEKLAVLVKLRELSMLDHNNENVTIIDSDIEQLCISTNSLIERIKNRNILADTISTKAKGEQKFNPYIHVDYIIDRKPAKYLIAANNKIAALVNEKSRALLNNNQNAVVLIDKEIDLFRNEAILILEKLRIEASKLYESYNLTVEDVVSINNNINYLFRLTEGASEKEILTIAIANREIQKHSILKAIAVKNADMAMANYHAHEIEEIRYDTQRKIDSIRNKINSEIKYDDLLERTSLHEVAASRNARFKYGDRTNDKIEYVEIDHDRMEQLADLNARTIIDNDLLLNNRYIKEINEAYKNAEIYVKSVYEEIDTRSQREAHDLQLASQNAAIDVIDKTSSVLPIIQLLKQGRDELNKKIERIIKVREETVNNTKDAEELKVTLAKIDEVYKKLLSQRQAIVERLYEERFTTLREEKQRFFFSINNKRFFDAIDAMNRIRTTNLDISTLNSIDKSRFGYISSIEYLFKLLDDLVRLNKTVDRYEEKVTRLTSYNVQKQNNLLTRGVEKDSEKATNFIKKFDAKRVKYETRLAALVSERNLVAYFIYNNLVFNKLASCKPEIPESYVDAKIDNELKKSFIEKVNGLKEEARDLIVLVEKRMKEVFAIESKSNNELRNLGLKIVNTDPSDPQLEKLIAEFDKTGKTYTAKSIKIKNDTVRAITLLAKHSYTLLWNLIPSNTKLAIAVPYSEIEIRDKNYQNYIDAIKTKIDVLKKNHRETVAQINEQSKNEQAAIENSLKEKSITGAVAREAIRLITIRAKSKLTKVNKEFEKAYEAYNNRLAGLSKNYEKPEIVVKKQNVNELTYAQTREKFYLYHDRIANIEKLISNTVESFYKDFAKSLSNLYHVIDIYAEKLHNINLRRNTLNIQNEDIVKRLIALNKIYLGGTSESDEIFTMLERLDRQVEEIDIPKIHDAFKKTRNFSYEFVPIKLPSHKLNFITSEVIKPDLVVDPKVNKTKAEEQVANYKDWLKVNEEVHQERTDFLDLTKNLLAADKAKSDAKNFPNMNYLINREQKYIDKVYAIDNTIENQFNKDLKYQYSLFINPKLGAKPKKRKSKANEVASNFNPANPVVVLPTVDLKNSKVIATKEKITSKIQDVNLRLKYARQSKDVDRIQKCTEFLYLVENNLNDLIVITLVPAIDKLKKTTDQELARLNELYILSTKNNNTVTAKKYKEKMNEIKTSAEEKAKKMIDAKLYGKKTQSKSFINTGLVKIPPFDTSVISIDGLTITQIIALAQRKFEIEDSIEKATTTASNKVHNLLDEIKAKNNAAIRSNNLKKIAILTSQIKALESQLDSINKETMNAKSALENAYRNVFIIVNSLSEKQKRDFNINDALVTNDKKLAKRYEKLQAAIKYASSIDVDKVTHERAIDLALRKNEIDRLINERVRQYEDKLDRQKIKARQVARQTNLSANQRKIAHLENVKEKQTIDQQIFLLNYLSSVMSDKYKALDKKFRLSNVHNEVPKTVKSYEEDKVKKVVNADFDPNKFKK